MRSITLVLILSALAVSGCGRETPLRPDSRVAGDDPSGISNRSLPALLPLGSPRSPRSNGASADAAPVRNRQVVHVPFFIQDASGGTPTAGHTPLFESRAHNPILAPAG